MNFIKLNYRNQFHSSTAASSVNSFNFKSNNGANSSVKVKSLSKTDSFAEVTIVSCCDSTPSYLLIISSIFLTKET